MIWKKLWETLTRKKVSNYNPIILNEIDKNYPKDFIYEWNHKFPIDRWWRQKHKVAFNSSIHREISFIDMRMEWEEDILFNKISKDFEYIPNIGDFMKENTDIRTEEERDIDFQNEFNNTFKKNSD